MSRNLHLGTFAVLSMIPASTGSKERRVSSITHGSTALRIGFVGVMAALLVSVGMQAESEARWQESPRVPFVVESTATCRPRLDKFIRGENAVRLDHRAALASGAVLLISQIKRDHAGRVSSFWWTSPF